MRKLSQAETACLLAIFIILAIGCERQRKAESSKQVRYSIATDSNGSIAVISGTPDTIAPIVDHSEIGKDTAR